MNLFDWIVKLTEEYWELFLNGTKNTLIMSLTGTIIGFLIGLVIAIIRTIPTTKNTNPVFKALLGAVNFVLNAYIEIIRGTPMMVQALIIHYSLFVPMGVSKIGDGILSAIIIISFNTGAYMAEIVRGGIISVDKGQFEGAHAIGMSHFQTMYHVVLPQAIRNIMPSIGNEFVVNIKDSSVLSVIAITELMFIAKQAGGTYSKFVPAYVICAVIYFILTFTVTRLLRLAEKKLAGSNSYTICGSQSDPNAEIHVKEGQ
jgi:putative lysine transport system permease protein